MLELYKKVGPKNLDPDKNPKAFIGKRIAKTFFDDQQIYLGTIKRYANDFWHVAYDDGKFGRMKWRINYWEEGFFHTL